MSVDEIDILGDAISFLKVFDSIFLLPVLFIWAKQK